MLSALSVLPVVVALAAVATVAVAAVDWYAVARARHDLETLAKPATLLLLLLVALLVLVGRTEPVTTAGWLLVAALLLGTLGDVALLDPGPDRFLAGLAAFLLGHLAYVGCFLTLGPEPGPLVGVALAGLAVSLVAGRRTLPCVARTAGPTTTAAVAAYMLVIGAMLLAAGATGSLLVTMGALVFVASDTVLGMDRFTRPVTWPVTWTSPWPHVVVMVTYHVGQGLVVAGVLAATA